MDLNICLQELSGHIVSLFAKIVTNNEKITANSSSIYNFFFFHATNDPKRKIKTLIIPLGNVVLSVNGKQAQQMLSTLQSDASNMEKNIANAAT